jgi:hypothetical protein
MEMTEFQWKNNFINQTNKTEHINKYELLLLILKVICVKTSKLEENVQSLKIQDFSVYEDYLINKILPKAKKEKQQSKLLHNQLLFGDLISKIKIDEPIEINGTNKRKLFEKFSKYVNLKDLRNTNRAYNLFSFSIMATFIFIIATMINHNNIWFLILFVLLSIFSGMMYFTFKGKLTFFILNKFRVNTELCSIQLQNELTTLEKLLKIPADPYKNYSLKDSYELFKNIYKVPSDFIEICQKNDIIDENNFVNSKYNHFLIQYLKKVRDNKYKDEQFDWQLINHVIIFDILKNRKSYFLNKNFKQDNKGKYYSSEGVKYSKFCEIFEPE